MITGDPTLDFLEQNPKLKAIANFEKIYKDHEPQYASKLLWSFYFITCIHDDNNPHKGYASIKKRVESIKTGYFPELDYSKYVYLYDSFQIFVLTKEEMMFNIQYKKLEEMSLFFDKLDIADAEDRAEFMTIAKALPSIWKGFNDTRTKVIESSKQGTTNLGNIELSGSEKRRQKLEGQKNKQK